MNFGGAKGTRMDDCLGHHDPTEPAMDQVEVVERDVQQSNQGVVSSGHQDQRDEIDDSKTAGSIAEDAKHLHVGLTEVDADQAKGNIHAEDAGEKDGLEACGKHAEVQSRGEAKFPVVTFAKQRCVKDVFFEECEHRIGHHEVVLRRVVETGECADVMDGQDNGSINGEGTDNGC